jgi:signal transduction histidine kinase/DNA-binding response OmpR family regulator/ABC-type amino acid transport substrate-binding protein
MINMKRIVPVIILLISFLSCAQDNKTDQVFSYTSFRDIPGITEDEIKAIEILQRQGLSFEYGMTLSTETFIAEDNEIKGYSVLLCKWMTELFDIQFKPVIYEWNDLIAGLDSGKIAFTGELTPNEERRRLYFMSDAIAMRHLKYIRLKDSKHISEISAERPLRLLFLEGSVTYDHVLNSKTLDAFEPVFTPELSAIYNILKRGEADAYIGENNMEAIFDIYKDIVSEDLFPIILNPISLSTKNQAYEPVISIMQKILKNGGKQHLLKFYNQGETEYLKNKFFMDLTNEEKLYIKLKPVVLVAAEYDNYPLCFFNLQENSCQGIAFDIMGEIETLTGLTFNVVNPVNQRIAWPEMVRMLEAGEVDILTELIQTEERKGRFIWPGTVIISNNYALLSKTEYPDINTNEIMDVRVGLTKETAYAEFFNNLFLNHEYTVEYENPDLAFDGLDKGEIDMVMSSKHRYLLLTNYREQPGYKANFVFRQSFNSTFGINKDDVLLCSIIDKALAMINIDEINDQWMNKTFDYRIRMISARIPWMIGATSFILVFAFILILFLRNRNINIRLEKLVQNRTNELEKQHALLETVNYSATALLTTVSDENFEASLLSGMELICQCMDVDRVHLWKNEMTDGELFFVLKYERSRSDRNIKPLPIGTKYSYAIRSDWLDMFQKGEYINSPLRYLQPKDQEFLNNFDIKHIVIIPLFIKEKLWGFFSIDDCHGDHIYMEEEINIFRSASLMMASAVNEHEIDKEIRSARDAAESSNIAKSAFLANMSHEIRAPMNSIIGFSELALNDDLPPKTKDYLRKIHLNADWLLQIINDILDISKIESGKMELERIPFDLHELFTNCRTFILPKAVEKGLTLFFYAEPSIGKKPVGDPTRLRQVILNLLSNAVKFTETGIIKLQAVLKQNTGKTIKMYFEVKDSGIGMTAKQLENIFEPFIQAETGTTRKYGGSGLGLSISKNIVELMGGKLSVESTPNLGSKFYFTLTFDTIDYYDDKMSGEKVALSELKMPTFEGEILLCEDNLMNQEVLCEHLARVGLKTVLADNGSIGLEIFKKRMENNEKQFNLIMTDIHMPVMDGLEFATEIRKLDETIPIVAITANIMPNDMEIYSKNGMNHCVSKPFTTQELWHCLMKYLTPMNYETQKENNDSEREFQKKNQLLFFKSNKRVYDEITDALESEDLILAHRLAHSLKSNAEQIGKPFLRKAAFDIELSLKDGKNLVTPQQLNTLKIELNAVFLQLQTELALLLDDQPQT